MQDNVEEEDIILRDKNKYICCLCPISKEIMLDPVIAADGFSYERSNIAEWLAIHNRSPMTNIVIVDKNLTPNKTLKHMISIIITEIQQETQTILQEAKQKLIEIQEESQGFLIFDKLTPECQTLLIGNLSYGEVKETWNGKLDLEKILWLNSKNIRSYQFLKEEFRQNLSEITQASRHQLIPHVSTEDFWNNQQELHEGWLETFSSKFSGALLELSSSLSSVRMAKDTLLQLHKKLDCFLSYEDLNLELMAQLDVAIGAVAKREWDNNSEFNKIELLLDKGINSYNFLKIEFRQYLSSITQASRHAISPHPSTEQFWNSHNDLQRQWIDDFEAELKNKLSLLQAIIEPSFNTQSPSSSSPRMRL